MRLALFFSLFVACSAHSAFFAAPQSQCTFVYSLQGPAYHAFQEQIRGLQPALARKRIRLLDLQKWNSQLPHLSLSGRERRLLRDQYQLKGNQSQALLIDHNHPEKLHYYRGSVDLVDALLNCGD